MKHGNDGRLDGNHHSCQHHPEQQIPSFELETGEGITSQ